MKIDFFQTSQVLLAAVVYGVVILWINYYSSYPPRDWLLERIAHLRTREGFRDQPTAALLRETETSLKRPWNIRASYIQACWRLVHAIEDEYAMHQPAGEVRVALESMRDRLAATEASGASELVERIDSAVEAADEVTVEHRALLREAQAFRHNLNDSAYEDLAHLMTKAMWLTAAGLAAIALLAQVKDRELYLLLGAAGGLMSRLTRILKEQPSGTDYGALWSTLILSPVSGALAAWIGIVLIAALGTEPVSLIDERIAPLVWDQGDHVFGLGLAFLLGFSERLFAGVVESAESRYTPLVTKKAESKEPGSKKKPKRRERPSPRSRRRRAGA